MRNRRERGPAVTRAIRFVALVETAPITECWTWRGSIGSHGYGTFGVVPAHRFSYELFVAKIPSRMTIDHLCENRLCVNPNHLEVVTQSQNILRSNGVSAVNARKKHCKNGHVFDLHNTWIRSNGERQCRRCRADAELRRRARLKAEGRLPKGH